MLVSLNHYYAGRINVTKIDKIVLIPHHKPSKPFIPEKLPACRCQLPGTTTKKGYFTLVRYPL